MTGTSDYPGALDNFAEASPTNLGDDDSTGRNHSERHDDVEAAVEAVQGELGVDPAGPSASTVSARFVALDTVMNGKISASVVSASADLIVGAAAGSVAALSSGSAGQVLTVSGSATYGLAWLDPTGGATVVMSPNQPDEQPNGTLWVDTDSDVPTFTASAYVLKSLVTAKGQVVGASGSGVPVAIAAASGNGQVIVSDSAQASGNRFSSEVGTLSFPDGTAAAPSITNTGDTNTGLLFPAADAVAISTDGAERVRVSPLGRLAVGVTGPVRRLHVSSGDNDGALIAGATLGIRFFSGAVASTIEGVDSTGSASYQPLLLGGSTVGITTSNTQRLLVDANGLITGTGSSLGAWVSYTPTLGGTGWALGDGVVTASFCQIGKIVHYRINLAIGSTTVIGSDNITFTLPVTSNATNRPSFMVVGHAIDASANALYELAGLANTTTTVRFATLGASGQHTQMNTTTPFTWASGDAIRAAGVYEIA